MLTFVTILLIIIAVLLVVIVLIQPGKGDMIAGMGTIGGSISNMFGSRRAMDLLTKITIGLAVAMFVLVIATNKFLVGQKSVEIVKPITEGATVPIAAPIQNIPMPEQSQGNE
jgi:preprotein translocase subunit SecG